MKCRLLYNMKAGRHAPEDICVTEGGVRYVPAGATIDNKDAYLLVHGGHAEALDDECQEAADRKDRESPDQKGVLREVYDMMINEQEEFREQVKEFESGDD